jgi:zinc/manganese transport system substrate-binding protein
MRVYAAVTALLALFAPPRAGAAPIQIVAAENMYGDVARQIGGGEVTVTSILSNPNQDPHLFEITASVARAVAAARIVISNGAGYDPWMARLLAATPAPERRGIVVADLAGTRTGDNPHIWYDPDIMARFAAVLAATLASLDGAHAATYAHNLQQFDRSLQPVRAAIAALRATRQDTSVTATEPVFDYMFAALGMRVHNARFQLAVMNDTEPSASGVAAFENSLTGHEVKLLVYNSQAADPVADRMRQIAREAGIPVVPVTETEPAGVDYQHWMLKDVQAVAQALGAP